MKLLIQIRYWMFVGRVCLWLNRTGDAALKWYANHSPVYIATTGPEVKL